jgi:uncharacterized ion transporter superfamily protein YfcC
MRMPSTLVVLAGILAFCALLTLVVPRGAFARVERELGDLVPHVVAPGEDLAAIAAAAGAPADLELADLIDARTRAPLTALEPGQEILVRLPGRTRSLVVPGTYARLEASAPRSTFEQATIAARAVVLAPLRGFVERSEVIGFVLLVGAAFGVLIATGAIDRCLARAVHLLGAGRTRILVVPAITVLFSLGGAILGMGEDTIAFVLVTIPLAIRLGYDTLTGVAMCYLASQVGFGGAFFNPFTIGIAQSIAELPYLSGLGFRIAIWFVVTAFAIGWIVWWAERVRRDPRRSPTFELDQSWRARLGAVEGASAAPLRARDLVVLAATLSTLVLSGLGVALFDWYVEEMAAVFVVAGLVGGAAAGFGPDRLAREFTSGAAAMVEPALVIALAAGVLGVLSDGQVLDSVLAGLAAPLDGLPGPLAAVLVMLGQAVLNFFVPSGSGQAALSMPVTAPLCDILGLDRQVGALAFQYGDGFGNMVIPTSAVLMGVLGAARVPWTVWLAWVWKFVLALYALAALALVVAVLGPSSWLR